MSSASAAIIEPVYDRRADLRFLLPQAPRRVSLVGAHPGWSDSLHLAGCTLIPAGSAVDTLFVGASAVRAMTGTPEADQVLVEGRRRPPAGWSAQQWRVAVRRHEPIACARPEDPDLVAQAVRRWAPASARNLAAQSVLSGLAARGVGSLLPTVTVLTRGPRPEHEFSRLAHELGAPSGSRPLVLLGGGAILRRVAVLLHPPGEADASHVLKVERLPSGDARPDSEQVTSRLARRLGSPAVLVPVSVGAGSWNGLPATLEEAAPGRDLDGLLHRHAGAADAALPVVTQWWTDLAQATARPPMPGAWRATGADAARRWPTHAAMATQAAERLEGWATPRVLEHGDVATCGNVVVGRRPAVIDWENGDEQGVPLRDLLPFLAYGLAVQGLPPDTELRAAAVLELCRGRSPRSAELGAAVREYVHRLGVPVEAVGPLALLSWLHHGGARALDVAVLEELGLPAHAPDSVAQIIAAGWVADPQLSLDWPALKDC